MSNLSFILLSSFSILYSLHRRLLPPRSSFLYADVAASRSDDNVVTQSSFTPSSTRQAWRDIVEMRAARGVAFLVSLRAWRVVVAILPLPDAVLRAPKSPSSSILSSELRVSLSPELHLSTLIYC